LGHLLLSSRRLLLFCGCLVLIIAAAVLTVSVTAGFILAVMSAIPLILSFSYGAIVFVARLASWTGVWGRKD